MEPTNTNFSLNTEKMNQNRPNPYPPSYSTSYSYDIHQPSSNGNVIYTATTVIEDQPVKHGSWNHWLISCSDCGECCMACLCPNLYACFLAKDTGESSCTALFNCFCFPLCLCCLRTKARGKHDIEGGICCDILATQCCPCCSMIQMRRQYTNRN